LQSWAGATTLLYKSLASLYDLLFLGNKSAQLTGVGVGLASRLALLVTGEPGSHWDEGKVKEELEPRTLCIDEAGSEALTTGPYCRVQPLRVRVPLTPAQIRLGNALLVPTDLEARAQKRWYEELVGEGGPLESFEDWLQLGRALGAVSDARVPK
jgi:hypothetical protein